MRVLISWIGHTDLRAMAAEQPLAIQKKISEVVGRREPLKGERGPVRTLVEVESFDRIYLLSNYPKNITRRFIDWLMREAEARYTSLSDPTNYGEIFAAVDTEMRAITQALDGKQYEISILLSPGTPAMAAIWVLLGKTKYPARFYQTYEGKASLTDIPFDLTVDFLPELLRGPDSVLQHLASRSPQEMQGFEHISGDSKAIRLAIGRAGKAATRPPTLCRLTRKPRASSSLTSCRPRPAGKTVGRPSTISSTCWLRNHMSKHGKNISATAQSSHSSKTT